jgi:hypothetical protein
MFYKCKAKRVHREEKKNAPIYTELKDRIYLLMHLMA